MSFIYIASPYSGTPEVMQERFEAAELFTVRLLNEGLPVYSPIVHCHALAEKYDLPKDFDFWQNHNRAILSKASGLIVLRLDGWRDSRGVQAEIEFANQCGIGIEYK
jgi:hypothetical protein